MRGVQVQRDFAPELPKVMLDQDLCEQVFTNLLMNACEAMGEQGGELQSQDSARRDGRERRDGGD